MKELTFSQLRAANILRQAHFPSKVGFTPEFYALSLAGEVGEMCNFLKKQLRDEVNNLAAISKEIADIQTYLDLLAASLGIDLAQVTVDKFNEVSKRIGSDVTL